MTDDDRACASELNQGDIALYDFACTLFEKRVEEQGPAFAQRVQQFVFVNEKYQRISRLLLGRTEASEQQGSLTLPKDSLW